MEVYTWYCKDAECKGILPVEDLQDEVMHIDSHRCVLANEFNLAISGIKFGVRVIDVVSGIEEFDVENYTNGTILDDHKAGGTVSDVDAVILDVEKEFKERWLRKLEKRPKYITAMFCRQEKDKIRVIKDYSAPFMMAINDFIDDRKTTMMSVCM